MVIDYYEILEIEQSATPAEIKAAYRRLAHLYHPDKNTDDKYSLARFQLVKEAYETLSKPYLRDEYLRQRWLNKAQGKRFSKAAMTPEVILGMFLEANRKVQNMDVFRSDKSGIAESILRLLSYDNVEVLNNFDDRGINHQVVGQALHMNSVLHPRLQEGILQELRKIKMDKNTSDLIANAEKQRKQSVFINKAKPWVIGFIVVLLCALVWLLGR